MGHHLVGGDSSWCPELNSRTTQLFQSQLADLLTPRWHVGCRCARRGRARVVDRPRARPGGDGSLPWAVLPFRGGGMANSVEVQLLQIRWAPLACPGSHPHCVQHDCSDDAPGSRESL